LGNPTFFVTVTANPKWPEITSKLRPGQNFHDIPMVVVRVFHAKLKCIISALSTMFPNVGPPVYKIFVIEFQKRGLPHAHILLKFKSDCVTPEAIDAIVSAELPTNEQDRQLIRGLLYHSHNDRNSEQLGYCQRRSGSGQITCRFRYPHRLQDVTTIDGEGRIHYRRRNPGDEWVVPHCLPLVRHFQCHINFEVSNTSHLFQYLFKYIHKGPDRTRYMVADAEVIDEIEEFWNGRYISAGEAAWRILGYHIAYKYPSVKCLPVHLPESIRHYQYHRAAGNESHLSLLNRYFLRSMGRYESLYGLEGDFDNLTYLEYFRLFRLVRIDAVVNNFSYAERFTPPGEVNIIMI
jgi:hypothetical protein